MLAIAVRFIKTIKQERRVVIQRRVFFLHSGKSNGTGDCSHAVALVKLLQILLMHYF